MSNLTPSERQQLENFLGMADGYILGRTFTDRSYADLFRHFNVDIDSQQYRINGDSKARRMRAFWDIDTDPVVGNVLNEILKIWVNDGGDTNDREYQECNKIINKLLGRRNSVASSKESFLQQKFGKISWETLPVDPFVIPVIKSRLEEAQNCLNANAPLATIFLCGSILEGVLLGLAIAHKTEFVKSPSAPKDGEGKTRQIPDWSLDNLINVACDVGFLDLTIKKFSHGAKDFRNYIHPNQQILQKFNPTLETAGLCLKVVEAVISQLNRNR